MFFLQFQNFLRILQVVYQWLNLLKEVLLEEPNRKILILSERREHLKLIYKLLDEDSDLNNTIGYYVGGMKQKDLDISKDEIDDILSKIDEIESNDNYYIKYIISGNGAYGRFSNWTV